MKRLLLTGLVAELIISGCKPSPKEEKKPNILVILADDLGFSDLGCYGGEINTPTLNNLAENGVQFTQFYNSARCCPSRASLLTGLYPHQAGIGSFVGPDRGVPGYAGHLTPNAMTIAEVLKSAGYRSFAAGKWHVNHPEPTQRGFEEFYGFLDDYGVDCWEPKWMKRYPEGRPERKYKDGEFFATNAITDYALDWLDSARTTPNNPWFMYVAYQAPHFPLQAPKEDIETYKNTYTVGWDTIRARRYNRMKEMGIIAENTKLSERSLIPIPRIAERNGVPGDGIHNPAWNILPDDRKADLARRMAVFAAMVDNMDQNIGRIIANLKANGELENTLIMFMSDNGSCAEWDPYGFEYPNYNDRVAGGTPGHPNVLHTGESLEKLGGPDGPLFSFGSGWANSGNTPFTLYKQFVHEGGISSPLIVYWPAKIKEHKLFTEKYAHITDIMATCVDVAGAKYPAQYNEHAITPMEGVSLFKTLNGDVPEERVLTFEHSGNPAIRIGDWKLVALSAMAKTGFKEDTKFQLYNIREDRSETNDLANRYPKKVEELKQKMFEEFNRTQVFPRVR